MFLEIRDIRKSFGSGDSKVDVLKGLDLDIEKGEFCVLLGPSGSGKSTLLNISVESRAQMQEAFPLMVRNWQI